VQEENVQEKNKSCRFASLPIKTDYTTKCKWKKNKQNNIKTCCRYLERCVGSKCTKKENLVKLLIKLQKEEVNLVIGKDIKKEED